MQSEVESLYNNDIGLGECLRQELAFHKIDVHVYYVGTIATPGYEEEV
jgi:hypothetical protein